MPLVRPVTCALVALPGMPVTFLTRVPAELYTRTRYSVIARPPLLAGAVQFTVAEALPAVALLPMVGAPGAVIVFTPVV